jgi:hypothetical protein
MYLKKIFGGIEVKRFTTPEKSSIVEVTYKKISFLIVEERCVYVKNMTLLVSKFDTFENIAERIKRLLLNYDAIPQRSLKKEW